MHEDVRSFKKKLMSETVLKKVELFQSMSKYFSLLNLLLLVLSRQCLLSFVYQLCLSHTDVV